MEGVAAMATHYMREEAKAFAEARLAARQAAAKSAPEMAQRGVVRAAPLSPALFDQPATDTIFASLPAATCPTAIQTSLPAPEALPALQTTEALLSHSPEGTQQALPEGPAAVSGKGTGLQALLQAQVLLQPPLPEGPLLLRVPLWAVSQGGQQPGPPTAGQQG
ncbi:hypothetical protein Pcinc_015662 [Petrolisthes cinctipes]|uniref:Uncharacterized protein n=1 Tax=Petrolisthes cinctipes TaxID=88211 RepID=A0AAE1FU09_PETCI|nr:hypothetical protein Pcinc_015662 [Petrolisthes cinctipes]